MDTETEVKARKYDQKIIWPMVFMFTFIMSGFLLGSYFILAGKVKTTTLVYAFIVFLMGGIGLGPGAHKLFAHHAFKTTRALKLVIIFFHQLSGVKSILAFVRIHRTHHKFVETDRDPTNIHRGIFWASVGCGMTTLPKECDDELARIHMDDVLADRDLVFQYENFTILYILISHALPTLIPYYFWNEPLHIAFTMNVFRLALNLSQLIIGQGLLHWNGRKPYDKDVSAVDNLAYNIFLSGEGNHNFHHTFPFDYRSNDISEHKYFTSPASFFIDTAAYFGWAWDRKVAPPQMIMRRTMRTGDGSHPYLRKFKGSSNLWGYGDPDMTTEEKNMIDVNGNEKFIDEVIN